MERNLSRKNHLEAQVFERLKFAPLIGPSSSEGIHRKRQHTIKGINVCRGAFKRILGIGYTSLRRICLYADLVAFK